jgi:hypothetical protein
MNMPSPSFFGSDSPGKIEEHDGDTANPLKVL